MRHEYPGVTTRFLRQDERFVLSDEGEMPLVIEAQNTKDTSFLQTFLKANSTQLLKDLSYYGAILLRGFDIVCEQDFEDTILSIQGLKGISEALMSEEGRTHVGHSNYILHTNAVYKTGGTLYLGGFHSENYYSPDVPGYICFACFEPSKLGGETGLVNMKKVYQKMSDSLKSNLEKNTFFVSKWLISDVARRYQIPIDKIEALCAEFGLPIVGKGSDKLIYMYKPNVLTKEDTGEKSLHINLFEIYRLNAELRKCFMKDYAQKEWFWHRFVWKLPKFIFKSIKFIYIIFASFFHSPKDATGIFLSKVRVALAAKKTNPSSACHETRVGSCFTPEDVKHLAQLIRSEYCSCLWKKGDVLLIDNKQVMHAGMPGAGPRVVRAMICNPLKMNYSSSASGLLTGEERTTDSIGAHMT